MRNLANREAQYRFCLLGIGVFCIAILYAGIGSIPLLSLNEARRAIPVAVMHATGDWLLPQLNGALYLAKPPLFYWFAGAISAIVGCVNEWTVRLPSALAATSILLMTFYAARKYFDRETALIVLVVLLTCSTFVMFARRAEIDMLFAALNTAALLSAHEFIASGRKPFLYASYAALGVAVLTKGPAALLFTPLPVLLQLNNERARAYLCCGRGWILLLGISISWYAWVASQLGFGVWHEIIKTDMGGKIYNAHGRDSVFTYVQGAALDFLPWSIALLVTPRRTWREWWGQPVARFFLIAVAVPLVAFTLMSDKHIKYLLPAYPALALLVAVRIAQIVREVRERYRQWVMLAAVILLTGYAVFYIAVERHVFAFRYSALADIQEIARTFPDASLSSYKLIDMRSVYYYGHPIKILSRADIVAAATSPQPQLVLIERERWQSELDMSGWRKVRNLTPYISRGQTAVVMGNAAFVEKYRNALP